MKTVKQFHRSDRNQMNSRSTNKLTIDTMWFVLCWITAFWFHNDDVMKPIFRFLDTDDIRIFECILTTQKKKCILSEIENPL